MLNVMLVSIQMQYVAKHQHHLRFLKRFFIGLILQIHSSVNAITYEAYRFNIYYPWMMLYSV